MGKVYSEIRILWLLTMYKQYRFIAVGLFNTFFGFLLFLVVYDLFVGYIHYIAILLISHFLSVIIAYLLYGNYVFTGASFSINEFVKFNTVYIGSITFNVFFLSFMVEYLKTNVVLSQGIAVIIGATISYIFHNKFTFRVR